MANSSVPSHRMIFSSFFLGYKPETRSTRLIRLQGCRIKIEREKKSSRCLMVLNQLVVHAQIPT